MLDPSKPAYVRAGQRRRSETLAWLTTVRADGQAQSSPAWFRADHVEEYLAKYGAGIQALGSEPGPFARTYSTAIRVRPTRVRAW